MNQFNAQQCEMTPSTVRSKNPRITVCLFERAYYAITELAERHDVSISWIARHAVAELIERHISADAKLPLSIAR